MNIQECFPLGDSFDLLAVLFCCPRDFQESSPASQFERISSLHSVFIMFSHLYMTTGKTIPLTKQTFVGKVTSLLKTLFFSPCQYQAKRQSLGIVSTTIPPSSFPSRFSSVPMLKQLYTLCVSVSGSISSLNSVFPRKKAKPFYLCFPTQSTVHSRYSTNSYVLMIELTNYS